MIDPIQSLAFAIQTHPGVYALLLGSGVSRAAGIPTGWDIALDLIGKLAAASNDVPTPDPAQWYFEKYGEAPDYSILLDRLAKTPTERQQLLRPYFEPTDQEREDGVKLPTSAHRAIARLVRQGFVKVIVTTNFDRLIESALQEEGISPEVLSSPDQVNGALPLTHVQHRVLKLNGDYLDSRIRNTPAELDGYPQEFNDHLDRIFDEFGLVVCGWSADWDGGLRDAIYRAPSRRFTIFWATRGEPTNTAERLIEHRRADVIPIESADAFFTTIEETVESIQEFSKPHPLSTETAIVSLKRYLPNAEYRIRLADLIDAIVEQALNATSRGSFVVQGAPYPTRELVTARLRSYESACSTLVAMAPIAGFWAEDDHFSLWERVMERLSTLPLAGGDTIWLALRAYPAMLLLYALGLGAVESGRLRFLNRVFNTRVNLAAAGNAPTPALITLINEMTTLQRNDLLEGTGNRPAPFNLWMHAALRQPLKQLIPDEGKYALTFDKLEILVGLSFAHLDKSPDHWSPLGDFVRRRQNAQRILTEIEVSISEYQHDSEYVDCGIFGQTPEECLQSLEHFKVFVSEVLRRWGISRF